MPSVELQPIVMAAGRGSRLTELTGDRPKCLLPVGPFPLVWYSLQMLEKHGFQDAIVVVLESHKSEVQSTLEKCPLKIKLEFATIPSDSDYGTADSLRHIKDRIKADILVISCDTITNASLFPLITEFRQHNASVAALFLKGGAEADTVVPGPKSKHKPERDLAGIDEHTKRLHFLASTSDYEDIVIIAGHLLRVNPHLVIHSRLIDAHVYIVRRWVVDYLVPSKGFSTIKGELVPFVIKSQLKRTGLKADMDRPFSVVNEKTKDEDVFDYVEESELEEKITATSLYNDTNARNPYNKDVIRCYATQAPDEAFGIRVNTNLGYCAANEKIFGVWEQLFGNDLDSKVRSVVPPPLICPNTTIRSTQMTQCAVGDNSIVAEKTSLKNCVLGTNCSVKPRTRISDSVLMNGVIIEEGVVIENCIISDRVVVNTGCVLKNCLIGPNYTVEAGKVAEKVHLSNADGFMEI